MDSLRHVEGGSSGLVINWPAGVAAVEVTLPHHARTEAAQKSKRKSSASNGASFDARVGLTWEPDVQAAQQRAPPLHPAPA